VRDAGVTTGKKAGNYAGGLPLWYQCILQPPVFYTVLGGFTYR